ncbi:uncharacterized protein LOC126315382 isoform X2 [Schistocerca gregaria]|uniref:uncharacterized protein LOC126315382 isoform X2 n=1 Tax=Schistocerca gregaria TaxID=7010 RepID=UPI00211EE892|nr:uncharacterized protein LOC126315382 isoform X2 [Schistocerca gregaria]
MDELPAPEQVHSMLVQYLKPNTQLVNEATVWLRKYLQMPQSIPVMFQILYQGPEPATRQAAGVVLHSWIRKHWNNIHPDVSSYIKQTLLQSFITEPQAGIRKVMFELVALIAHLSLSRNQWPEFWPAMFQYANSSQPLQLCLVLDTVEKLVVEYEIFDSIRPGMSEFLRLFEFSLSPNQDPSVRVAAVKAVCGFMCELSFNDPLIPLFKPIVISIIDVIKLCIEKGAEQELTDIFINLQTQIETCSEVIRPELTNLMQIVFSICVNQNADIELRRECFNFIQSVLQYCTGMVTKSGLVEPIIAVGLKVAAEPEESDDTDSCSDYSPNSIACGMLFSMASYVKPKQYFTIMTNHIGHWIQSPNFWERRASIDALSAVISGCSELVCEHLEDYIKLLETAFRDQSIYVQRAAALLLSQYTQHLVPEILEYNRVIFPIIFQALSQSDLEIQGNIMCSISFLVENASATDILPYLNDLMIHLVQIASGESPADTKELAVDAICSVATVAGSEFLPYWKHVINVMQKLIDQTNRDLLTLRGHAMECVGVIANAVSSKNFQPYYQYFMEKALEGLQLPNVSGSELEEYTIIFFSSIAESLNQDFIHYLPSCLDAVLKSLNSDDDEKSDTEREMSLEPLLCNEEAYEFDDDASNNYEESDPENIDYISKNSCVEIKCTCLHAIGCFANALGPFWVPYIDRCMPILIEFSNYINPRLRIRAMYPLEIFAKCISLAHPAATKWSPGDPPEQHPLSEETMNFLTLVLDEIIRRIPADFDTTVVARYISTLSFFLETLGAPSLHARMSQLVPLLVKILKSEIISQIDEINPDGENEEVQQEAYNLFDVTCEFVVALANAYKRDFLKFFPLIKGIVRHVKGSVISSKDHDDIELWRQCALGTLAEILEATGVECYSETQLHNYFLSCAFAGVRNTSVPNKANAVYIFRLCVSSPSSLNYYSKILEQVVPGLHSQDPQLRENCAGCIGKMILTASHVVPIFQVMPSFLNVFPVSHDPAEYPYSYGALIFLLEQDLKTFSSYIPQIFKAFLSAIGLENMQEDVRTKLVNALRHIWNMLSNQLHPVLNELSQEQLGNFRQYISQ